VASNVKAQADGGAQLGRHRSSSGAFSSYDPILECDEARRGSSIALSAKVRRGGVGTLAALRFPWI